MKAVYYIDLGELELSKGSEDISMLINISEARTFEKIMNIDIIY